MSALPVRISPASAPGAPDQPTPRELPDYLPARMVNEFVYCPRLFFYEWIEGVFRENADTLEGAAQHKRVDARATALPEPTAASAQDKADDTEARLHARSVTLSSERLRVIATLDLVEAQGQTATPVDYKHGAPLDSKDGLALWPTDRVQLALQAIVLRENGYQCHEAVVFYQKTRQRVRIPVDDALIAEAEDAVARAWALAAYGVIPAPLEDSPKCFGCSLNTICLPDETNALIARGLDSALQMDLFAPVTPPRKPPSGAGLPNEPQPEIRRLMTPRDDLRPLYLNTQGLRVGKSGEVLQIKDKDKVIQEARIGELNQVNLLGNIQISTQAVQTLCEAAVPVSYFSMGGYFYGITTGMNTKNVVLRRSQFRLADSAWFPVSLARALVAGKIRNQRTMLQRNHIEPKPSSLAGMKSQAERAERAPDIETLLGIEGYAARIYFEEFAGMIKIGDDDPGSAAAAAPPNLSFDFEGRNRRPPRDPVNALLSLAYSVLSKDLTIACYAVGFDPYMGFYHQLRHGRPALALDLMEPFRPLIADSAVLSAINTRMVTERDFIRAGGAVALTPSGRKGFFRAYELRMDSLVTHPLFEYRVSYRRLLEIQVRLLARVIEGEISTYPVFVTR